MFWLVDSTQLTLLGVMLLQLVVDDASWLIEPVSINWRKG